MAVAITASLLQLWPTFPPNTPKTPPRTTSIRPPEGCCTAAPSSNASSGIQRRFIRISPLYSNIAVLCIEMSPLYSSIALLKYRHFIRILLYSNMALYEYQFIRISPRHSNIAALIEYRRLMRISLYSNIAALFEYRRCIRISLYANIAA